MSSELKPVRKEKYEITADLFSKLSQIPYDHSVLNQEITTPYDCYMDFVDRVLKEFPGDQICKICDPTGNKKNPIDILTPSFCSFLAFRRLKSILGVSIPKPAPRNAN